MKMTYDYLSGQTTNQLQKYYAPYSSRNLMDQLIYANDPIMSLNHLLSDESPDYPTSPTKVSYQAMLCRPEPVIELPTVESDKICLKCRMYCPTLSFRRKITRKYFY